MDKLIQFVKDPSQDTNFAGKSKDVKGLEPKTVTAEAPTVHFCIFANLHSAIQSQPEVLQKFVSANYDTILWFGSGSEVLVLVTQWYYLFWKHVDDIGYGNKMQLWISETSKFHLHVQFAVPSLH